MSAFISSGMSSGFIFGGGGGPCVTGFVFSGGLSGTMPLSFFSFVSVFGLRFSIGFFAFSIIEASASGVFCVSNFVKSHRLVYSRIVFFLPVFGVSQPFSGITDHSISRAADRVMPGQNI